MSSGTKEKMSSSRTLSLLHMPQALRIVNVEEAVKLALEDISLLLVTESSAIDSVILMEKLVVALKVP